MIGVAEYRELLGAAAGDRSDRELSRELDLMRTMARSVIDVFKTQRRRELAEEQPRRRRTFAQK